MGWYEVFFGGLAVILGGSCRRFNLPQFLDFIFHQCPGFLVVSLGVLFNCRRTFLSWLLLKDNLPFVCLFNSVSFGQAANHKDTFLIASSDACIFGKNEIKRNNSETWNRQYYVFWEISSLYSNTYNLFVPSFWTHFQASRRFQSYCCMFANSMTVVIYSKWSVNLIVVCFKLKWRSS